MKLRMGLLRWLLRRTRAVTLLSLPVVLLFVLFWPHPLTSRSGWPVLFIFGHSLFVTGAVGGLRGGTRAFLYSRGFSRDTLWGHCMVATALCALAVWLPASVAVWSGLRSFVQDSMARSPWFPVMAPAEMFLPWLWLGLYALVAPVFHYGWIRAAQPTRAPGAGLFLMVGMALCLLTVFILGFPGPWFRWVACAGGLGIFLAALLGALRLHRRTEVQT